MNEIELVEHCRFVQPFIISNISPFLAANNLSKSGLQYGFPSRSKYSDPDKGFLQGPEHTKWSSCHT